MMAVSVIAFAALAATALVNRHLARKAERENPPAGRFLQVDGVRLHYVERGTGDPLVLLHGNLVKEGVQSCDCSVACLCGDVQCDGLRSWNPLSVGACTKSG